MVIHINIHKLLLAIGLSTLSLLATTARAEDFYIAQSALGTGTGASAANAAAITFFNTASNWATGTGKISPGDTVRLVGTISSTLTIQGSGSAGLPIIITFEPGAKISKPYWGIDAASAIYASGRSYITIDGNLTGIVECSANGDTMANNQPSYGITFTGGSSNMVKNLTVQNIYVHTYGTANLVGTYTTRCIYVENSNNFAVVNCTLNNAYLGVYVLANGQTVTNNIVERNTISACSTAVVFACGGLTNDAITGFSMRYNDVSMGGNWYEAADLNHIDGIHTWTSAGTMSGLTICGNYFHGNPSQNCTSQIYLTDNLKTCYVYNNLIVGTTTRPAEGFININLTGTADAYIYNNTIVGLGTTTTGGNGFAADPSRAGTTVHMRNNIFSNCYVGIYDGSSAATWDSDYNVISGCGNVAFRTSAMTLATWKTATGGDSHTSTNSPNLSSTYYVPTAGSSAIGTGADLTAIGKTLGIDLTYDITGTTRTSWDIGMVRSGVTTWKVTPMTPPTNAITTSLAQ
jgi:parallel beta-helix repeat protein